MSDSAVKLQLVTFFHPAGFGRLDTVAGAEILPT